MKIELLKNVKTLEELKAAYRKLAFNLHPDRGGNKEQFQKLVNEYEYLSKTLKNTYGYTETEESAKDFINVINELMRYFEDKPAVTVELKGTWFWVWGTVKEDIETKNFLTGLKFRWNRTRSCWQHGNGRGKGQKDIEEINSKYGNKVIKQGTKPPNYKPSLA